MVAVADLYLACAPLAMRRLGAHFHFSRDDAADVVQDVACKLVRCRAKVEGLAPEAARSYFYEAITHAAIDLARHQHSPTGVALAAALRDEGSKDERAMWERIPDPAASPERRVLMADFWREARAAAGTRAWHMLMMHQAGYPIAAIAAWARVSEAATKMILMRARARIRAALESEAAA